MADALFYLFSAVVLGTGVLVVASRNALNSAMFFLLCLLGTAALFVLLEAFLLAALLVLVYAGAVVALFLFIIMLLDMQGGTRKPFTRGTIVAATGAAALLSVGVLTFARHAGVPMTPPAPGTPGVGASLQGYAAQLFTTYLLPVQVVGFLLLIAMLGVIVLSKRFPGMEDVK
jgi:NADH-quinone oxidoreductase subunit J